MMNCFGNHLLCIKEQRLSSHHRLNHGFLLLFFFRSKTNLLPLIDNKTWRLASFIRFDYPLFWLHHHFCFIILSKSTILSLSLKKREGIVKDSSFLCQSHSKEERKKRGIMKLLSNRHAHRFASMGAICVHCFDDSLKSAIHITYRILLRASSFTEPRYPLLRVVWKVFSFITIKSILFSLNSPFELTHLLSIKRAFRSFTRSLLPFFSFPFHCVIAYTEWINLLFVIKQKSRSYFHSHSFHSFHSTFQCVFFNDRHGYFLSRDNKCRYRRKPDVLNNNDPSAGSPTETLLRLLLPLLLQN